MICLRTVPSRRTAAVTTPQTSVPVGDVFVTASDITQAIEWLEANMGAEFTFTQGMKGLSNPLAAWSAKQGYKGLKKNLHSSTIPAKGKIRDHLRLVLASAEAIQDMENAAWIAAEREGSQGFSIDLAEKVAIEMRAMAAARTYYAKLGWLEDAADSEAYKHNSFDLILHHNNEVKHVEVKGTTQKTDSPDAGIRIFLTPNEVAHARGYCKATVKCHSIGLFVLTDVRIAAGMDRSPAATGGNPRVYDPWHLVDGALEPIAYSYHVTGQ
jgi:hypothetical protein